MLAGACLVAGALAFHHLPARAAEFVAAGGSTISGDIIRFTKSTVTIRPAGGSMILIAPDDIELVRYELNDGSVIEGALHDWDDGTYVLEVLEQYVSAKDGVVLSEAPAAQHEGLQEEDTDVADDVTSTLASPQVSVAEVVDVAEEEGQPRESDDVGTGGALAAVDPADRDDVLEIKATADDISEEAEALIVDISSSRPSTDDIIILITTLDGAAKAGSDFERTSGIVRLMAGETKTQFVIPLIDDDEAEDDEQLTLYLSSAIGVATIPERKISATILDDD
ncbi:MAG: Calx-beta domain-containing protein [Pseudomonadota bacterium]